MMCCVGRTHCETYTQFKCIKIIIMSPCHLQRERRFCPVKGVKECEQKIGHWFNRQTVAEALTATTISTRARVTSETLNSDSPCSCFALKRLWNVFLGHTHLGTWINGWLSGRQINQWTYNWPLISKPFGGRSWSIHHQSLRLLHRRRRFVDCLPGQILSEWCGGGRLG